MFDYGGKAPEAPAFHATLVDTEDDESHEQYWSAGKASDWEIGDDGASLIPVGKPQAINVSSNMGQLLVSLGNAGFPDEALAAGDVTVLEGMVAHVMRVEMKRKGLKKENDKGYEQTCLCVDEIKTLPDGIEGEAGTTEAKDEEANADAEKAATDFVKAVLKKDKEVAKKDLPKKAFGMIEDEDDRNAILEYIFSDDFLNAGPWTYKDGVIKKK
jgi:hypothetical protein